MGNRLICMTKKDSGRENGRSNSAVGSRSKRADRSKRRSVMEEELLHRQALSMAIQQHQLSQRFDASMSRRIGSTSSRRHPSESFPATAKQSSEFLESIKTKKFVLIHGEGFGAWCWYKTIALLEETGLAPIGLDLTGSGIDLTDTNNVKTLEDYSKPLLDYLKSLPEDEKDLVRGPPVALSQIPSELSSFKTKMTGAIRNLIHTRLSPPSQVPTTPIMDGGLLVQMERDATTPPALALEDANRSKETSVEFHVGEAIDGESKAMKTTDKGSNTMDNKEGGPEVVNAYKSDPTSHDYYAPVSVTRSADLLKDQALGVFITTNIQLVVSSYVLPATKVFDLDDVIKLEHPIIVDALGQMFGYMSYFFHSAPMSNLLALWSSSGLLWFSTFSTVQKHEWEPPP